MHSKTITTAALLGLSAIAAARPATENEYQYTDDSKQEGGQQAFDFPLANGFPNITKDSANQTQIELLALGQLPNGAAPNNVSAGSVLDLGFVAFNELFEVAFFTELVYNLTHVDIKGSHLPGFTDDDLPKSLSRDELVAIFTVHQNQEELHELNAAGAFTKFSGGQVIKPCEYVFPVQTFTEAVKLAALFTDMVQGTLPDVQNTFGLNKDIGLIRGVGLVIGQEGEQDGFYRNLLGLAPAALPFNTASAVPFAFNAIVQNFVTGSCASVDLLTGPKFATISGLPTFGVLTNTTDLGDGHTDIKGAKFIGSLPKSAALNAAGDDTSALCITYLNQASTPSTVDTVVTNDNNGNTIFTADFPALSEDFSGLVIVAVTKFAGKQSQCLGNGFADQVANPDLVAGATVLGPLLFEADNKVDDLIKAQASATQSSTGAYSTAGYSSAGYSSAGYSSAGYSSAGYSSATDSSAASSTAAPSTADYSKAASSTAAQSTGN